MKRIARFFAVLSSFAVLFSCSGNSEESVYVSSFAEDVSVVDKSEYPYLSYLDSYQKKDWSKNTKWIWSSHSHPNQYQAFRKDFSLEQIPQEAFADIAAENNYYLWVNGEMVVFDGGSNRGPTPFDTYYENVDLSSYLKVGENNITILVEYIGRTSSSITSAGQGGLLFELKLADQTIASNQLFKTKEVSSYKTEEEVSDYPETNMTDLLSEWNLYYDNRDSIGDFTSPDYDDSTWNDATLVSTPGTNPFNDTYLNLGKIQFDKNYQDASDDERVLNQYFEQEREVTFSLDKNRQYSLFFTLEAKEPGLKLSWHSDTYEVSYCKSFIDTYITSQGKQSFEALPWRSGSKVIMSLPAGVKLLSVGYRASGYDSEVKSQFVSSDESLNLLYQKAGNTLSICMRDFFMDCPDRERSPWIGDASSEIKTAFYLMDTNSLKLIKKMILTMVGWTNKDGIFPSRFPSSSEIKELPSQNLHFLNAAYTYCYLTNDLALARVVYEIGIRYLSLWTFDENDRLNYRRGSWRWYDWSNWQDTTLLELAWYDYGVRTMISLAELLNEDKDQEFLSQQKTKVESEISSYKEIGSGYRSSEDRKFDDRVNALLVVSGMVDPSYYADIRSVLLNQQHASPYMESYVLEALCQMGYEEDSYQRLLSRYQNMIQSSDTTLWEDFTKGANSCDHGWSAAVARVMQEYYAGIRILSPAYQEYEVEPVDFLSDLVSQVDTEKGSISFSLKKEENKTTLSLSTVSGTCHLKLRKSFGSQVNIQGGEYTFEGEEENEFVYSLKQGSYQIEIK